MLCLFSSSSLVLSLLSIGSVGASDTQNLRGGGRMELDAPITISTTTTSTSSSSIGSSEFTFNYDEDGSEPTYLEAQFSPNPYLTEIIAGGDAAKRDLVLSGELTLMNVYVPPPSSSSDVDDRLSRARADFCQIDFASQQADPSTAPMYRHIVGQSTHCTDHRISLPLHEIANAARAHDQKEGNTETASMELGAFLFHQPKSGSSLVSNVISTAAPESTRVISESSVVSNIVKACGGASKEEEDEASNCKTETQVELLRDAVYLLGRYQITRHTDLSERKQLFVKVDPTSAVHMNVFREAFPSARWVFVYRDPNTIVSKLLASAPHKRSYVTKARRNPHKGLSDYVSSARPTSTTSATSTSTTSTRNGNGNVPLQDLTDEQLCSASLATMFRTATQEHEQSGTGRLINYDTELSYSSSSSSSGASRYENLVEILAYLKVEVRDDDEVQRGRIEAQLNKRANKGGSRVETWTPEMESQNLPPVTEAVSEANAEFLQAEMERMDVASSTTSSLPQGEGEGQRRHPHSPAEDAAASFYFQR